MTKFKAVAIHLGISLIIFLAILALILFAWYPPPFFSHDGGWQGIRIIAAVDLVLGPFLTIFVYKKGKPKLLMDISIIAIVQLAALSWGIWTVYSERPVATVFSENRFNVIAASTFKHFEYDLANLKQFGQKNPVWIFSKLPDDIDAAQKIRVRALQEKTPMHLYTEFYVSMHALENKHRVLQNSAKLQKWISGNKDFEEEFKRFEEKHKKEMNNISFFSFQARYGRKVIALRNNDLSYVGVLDIKLPIQAEL